MESEERSLAQWIEDSVRRFAASPENDMGNGEPAWGEPLVGFSRGDDPVYARLKASIGPFYWEPVDAFQTVFPDLAVAAGELTVVAWVLPQTEKTKADSRKETCYPAERWARSRKFGEEFNGKLRGHLVGLLGDAGYEAMAPQNSPRWESQVSERYGLSSTWSERHAAFASGLGTFGLSDGLITPAGKAMRCGSVVARMRVPPTDRPYSAHDEYCLFRTEGTCGRCIERCPVGAISEDGHDKERCREYIRTITEQFIRENYGLPNTYGCGLCQTGVPCESRIPAAGG